MSRARTAFESADTVNRVVALLVRFPELHSIRSNPAAETLTLTWAVACRLDAAAVRLFGELVTEHVGAFHELGRDRFGRTAVTCERGSDVTFLHVTRDLATFSPAEFGLLADLFAARFGDVLLRNPAADGGADDVGAAEEAIELALDTLRDPAQRQRLVGVRDEQRVLVYFVHPGKRAKVRSRS